MKKTDLTESISSHAQRADGLQLVAGKAVGAAFQTTRLMAYAANSQKPWTAADAARSLEINSSTCFNLIQTLLAVGWLAVADPLGPGKRYILGSGFVNLAHRIAVRTVDMHDVLPRLQEYADRWKVTATIWHRQSATRMELVAVASCQTAVNVQMPIGQRLPVLMGGMGRVMALQGGMDEPLREAIFQELRWDRSLTYSQFMAQARKAKRVGWGVDDGYMNRSVTALAVPVACVPEENVEYVCSATMFRHQYAPAALPKLAEALLPIAREVASLVCPMRTDEESPKPPGAT